MGQPHSVNCNLLFYKMRLITSTQALRLLSAFKRRGQEAPWEVWGVWGLPGQTVGQTQRAWLWPQVAGGDSQPGACLLELLTHTGPHALRPHRSSTAAVRELPTQDKWPPVLRSSTTQSKMQLPLTSARPRTSQAPGVSWLDSEEDCSHCSTEGGAERARRRGEAFSG